MFHVNRYPNFDLGETDEETVLVGASCCIEKVTLAVTDVAGNTNEFEATKWDYGSSPLLAWWVWLIIGKFYSKFLILFCSVWVRLYDMNGLIQTA